MKQSQEESRPFLGFFARYPGATPSDLVAHSAS
jgi:hypothetical protein